MHSNLSENHPENQSYIPDSISVEDINNLSSLDDAYQCVAKHFNFAKHPYFIWMTRTEKQLFAKSQIPFRYAVEGFSCALAATLAKIPELERRKKLAENVAEEHGLIGAKIPHKQTISQFLNVMGIANQELDIPCPTGVHAFNESLRNYCLSNSPEAGAALLGIIEYVFITISNVVADHIITKNWAAAGSQRHYEVHELLDIEHSQVLFDICGNYWSVDLKRQEICQGLLLGAYYFWDLYKELLEGTFNYHKC